MLLLKKIAVSLFLILGLLPSVLASDDEGVELVDYMSSLQYFLHKTGLAVHHQNQALVAFYVHELEEVLEQVGEVKSYDGHAISKLSKSTVEPSLEQFEAALKKGDWEKTSVSFDGLIDACNQCHDATDHAYIKIRKNLNNPYMQQFD